jgi:mono/diheme cytochrome c family protein
MDSFGCTACHGGRDRGTSFANTAHTPDNPKQQKEWEAKYHWEPMHYWETPMRSRSHFYAGCYQCHNRQVSVPEATPLNRGLRIVEVAGCSGCHAIKGFEGLRKVGPDLTHIASKTDEKWAFKWVRAPRSFRTGARMPSFFGQDNQKDPAKGDRPTAVELNDAEIEAMVAYIWDKSTPIKYDAVPGTGNAAHGKELLRSIGCLGCHTDDPNEKFADRSNPRAFGPNLGGVGSKTSQAWLYRWLKDPKHYWKDTFMPNLRLTDAEALDISAYLAGLRNAEFDKLDVPSVTDKSRDWLTREYLSSRLSAAETTAKMQSMDARAKKLYLGERMITKYGCFACHQIKGFENAQPIGTELTEEGSKPITRLDYGLEEDTVAHTLPAWVSAKLENPRRFDRGKIKSWDEKLKMPNFHFTAEENTELVSVIQAFSKARMDVDMRRTLSGPETFIEEGRRTVRDHNCVACHTFERDKKRTDALGEAAIRGTIQDVGYWPPMLAGEGEKVIPVWLFSFLKAPSTIRPWLNVRMPTFGLTDHETVAVTRMFAHIDKAEYPFESDYFKLEPPAPEIVAGGSKLFTEFKCLQCHVAGAGKPERDAADLAPNLSLARARLRPLWIEKWLRNPEALQPGTRMPGFFPDMKSPDKETLGGDAAVQIRALRYHVLGLSGKGTPVATGN